MKVLFLVFFFGCVAGKKVVFSNVSTEMLGNVSQPVFDNVSGAANLTVFGGAIQNISDTIAAMSPVVNQTIQGPRFKHLGAKCCNFSYVEADETRTRYFGTGGTANSIKVCQDFCVARGSLRMVLIQYHAPCDNNAPCLEPGVDCRCEAERCVCDMNVIAQLFMLVGIAKKNMQNVLHGLTCTTFSTVDNFPSCAKGRPLLSREEL
jgi:hypothetical protein